MLVKVVVGKSPRGAFDYALGNGRRGSLDKQLTRFALEHPELATANRSAKLAAMFPEVAASDDGQTYLAGSRARIIGGNARGRKALRLAHEFERFRSFNPKVENILHHAILSAPEGVRPSVRRWRRVSRKYLAEMGYERSLFIVVQHRDKECDHIHIYASNVTIDGAVVRQWQNKRHAEAVVREICVEEGLQPLAPSRESLRHTLTRGEQEREKESGAPGVMKRLQDAVDEVIAEKKDDELTMTLFVTGLEARGVGVRPFFLGNKTLKGLTYELDGVHMKGSALGQGYKCGGVLARGVGYTEERDLPALLAAKKQSLEAEQERKIRLVAQLEKHPHELIAKPLVGGAHVEVCSRAGLTQPELASHETAKQLTQTLLDPHSGSLFAVKPKTDDLLSEIADYAHENAARLDKLTATRERVDSLRDELAQVAVELRSAAIESHPPYTIREVVSPVLSDALTSSSDKQIDDANGRMFDGEAASISEQVEAKTQLPKTVNVISAMPPLMREQVAMVAPVTPASGEDSPVIESSPRHEFTLNDNNLHLQQTQPALVEVITETISTLPPKPLPFVAVQTELVSNTADEDDAEIALSVIKDERVSADQISDAPAVMLPSASLNVETQDALQVESNAPALMLTDEVAATDVIAPRVPYEHVITGFNPRETQSTSEERLLVRWQCITSFVNADQVGRGQPHLSYDEQLEIVKSAEIESRILPLREQLHGIARIAARKKIDVPEVVGSRVEASLWIAEHDPAKHLANFTNTLRNSAHAHLEKHTDERAKIDVRYREVEAGCRLMLDVTNNQMNRSGSALTVALRPAEICDPEGLYAGTDTNSSRKAVVAASRLTEGDREQMMQKQGFCAEVRRCGDHLEVVVFEQVRERIRTLDNQTTGARFTAQRDSHIRLACDLHARESAGDALAARLELKHAERTLAVRAERTPVAVARTQVEQGVHDKRLIVLSTEQRAAAIREDVGAAAVRNPFISFARLDKLQNQALHRDDARDFAQLDGIRLAQAREDNVPARDKEATARLKAQVRLAELKHFVARAHEERTDESLHFRRVRVAGVHHSAFSGRGGVINEAPEQDEMWSLVDVAERERRARVRIKICDDEVMQHTGKNIDIIRRALGGKSNSSAIVEDRLHPLGHPVEHLAERNSPPIPLEKDPIYRAYYNLVRNMHEATEPLRTMCESRLEAMEKLERLREVRARVNEELQKQIENSAGVTARRGEVCEILRHADQQNDLSHADYHATKPTYSEREILQMRDFAMDTNQPEVLREAETLTRVGHSKGMMPEENLYARALARETIAATRSMTAQIEVFNLARQPDAETSTSGREAVPVRVTMEGETRAMTLGDAEQAAPEVRAQVEKEVARLEARAAQRVAEANVFHRAATAEVDDYVALAGKAELPLPQFTPKEYAEAEAFGRRNAETPEIAQMRNEVGDIARFALQERRVTDPTMHAGDEELLVREGEPEAIVNTADIPSKIQLTASEPQVQPALNLVELVQEFQAEQQVAQQQLQMMISTQSKVL